MTNYWVRFTFNVIAAWFFYDGLGLLFGPGAQSILVGLCFWWFANELEIHLEGKA